MTTLYPRLNDADGRVLLAGIRGQDIETLVLYSGTDHSAAFPAPTGGIPARRDQLEALATAIRNCAQLHGYPHPLGRRDLRTTKFDRALAPVVYGETDMTPAEASAPEVWTFMATRLVPDIVMWRWKNQPNFNEERWIDRTLVRHTLGRVWWQAYSLGIDTTEGRDYSLLSALLEDDLNQIFERRSIGGNPPLAQALARELANSEVNGPPHRDLVRDVTKRVRRLIPFTSFLSMDDDAIQRRMRDLFTESVSALTATS